MVRTPITDSDAGSCPATLDQKRLQSPITVNVRAFQVVPRCPGISVIGAIGEQDAERHVVFRDGKLCDPIRVHLLEVQRQSRIEFAWVADFTRHRTVRQIGLFHPDVHVKGLIGPIAVAEQGSGGVA